MQAVLASEFPVDAASVERAHRPNQRDGGGLGMEGGSKGARGEGGDRLGGVRGGWIGESNGHFLCSGPCNKLTS